MFAGLPPVLGQDRLRAVGHGHKRIVYEVEGAPSILVKLPRDGAGYVGAMLRAEVRMARLSVVAPDMPVARTLGLYPTDRGPGVVVGALRDASGGIAPTLRALHAGPRGAPGDAALLLTRCAAEARRSGLPVNDCNLGNFVLVERPGPPDERRRLLMVDGFGDGRRWPVYHWSAALRDRQTARRFRKAARQLGLSWDMKRWSMR